MAIIVKCACGREYDRASWKTLPYVGVQVIPEDDTGPEERYEQRNCPCGSTISVDVNDLDASSNVDALLWAMLGPELDAAAWPLPPTVPSFAAETIRPKGGMSCGH